ncbi:MAG TPA: hemolysin family protein [Longimicrobiales bacterium]|nr:hemolysin family protein [Longimicrobiales bacterium]
MMIPLLLAFLVALALSAALTLAEVAVFSLGESRLRTLVGEGFRGSQTLHRLREQPAHLLLLLRFGTAVADAAAGVSAGVLGWLLWGAPGLLAALAGATLGLLLLGHLLPARVGLAYNVRIALHAAGPLSGLLVLLSPLLVLGQPLVRGLPDRPVPALAGEPEEEVRQLTELGHTEGVIEEEERQLIERAFRLDETRADEIMTPRVDVFAWPDRHTLRGIARQLQTVPYSRIPVYGDSVDDITGVLYIRDAYQALLMGQRDVPLRELAREPLIVPGSIPLTRLLKDFQGRRIHLAVVVDEYGGTDGLVTLEDVLEELVGEIVDETDIAEEPIARISRHEIVAAGDADLREINHFFNTSFPLLEHRSLNGYLLDELGRVPQRGERLLREGVEVEILEASDTQVLRARLERTALPGAGDADGGAGSDEVEGAAAEGAEHAPTAPSAGALEGRGRG